MDKPETTDSAWELASPELKLFDEYKFLVLSNGQIAVLAAAITWIPLIVLAAIQGLALGPSRAQSVLLDPGMFVRFLIALAILILTPNVCASTMNAVAGHFLKAGLVQEPDLEIFSTAICSVSKLRKSRGAVWIRVISAYAYSAFLVLQVFPGMSMSWRVLGSAGHNRLSLAGWWFVVISQPIYVTVLLRFFNGMALWWRFLCKTSRLNLQLRAVHPDRAAGLAFLGLTLFAFRLPAFAISASVAGGLANLVLIAGARISEFRYAIVAIVLLIVGAFTFPLACFYYLALSKARQREILNYWNLHEALLREFEQKWISSHSKQSDRLSVADFSEVIELSSILERPQRMIMLPFQRGAILTLTLAASLPFLLVAALEFPVSEILKSVVKLMV